MFHYQISGWTLTTPFPLPHLFPCPAPVTADITVQQAPVAPPRPPLLLDRDGIRVGVDGAVVIEVPDCVRLGLTHGTSITVDPAPGAPWSEIQSWILGPGLGVICHQRGVIPLHACALRGGGGAGTGALAIVGNSGAGKSTTAAALIQRGHRLLGDDVLVVDPQTALAQPCFPVVKLWDGSRSALNVDPTGLQPVARHSGKWHVPMLAAFDPSPRPLTAIVHLRADPDVRRPILTRRTPIEAAAILDAMTYRSYLAVALQGRQHVLSAAVRLAGHIPVWEMVRTTDFSDLPEMLDMLEGMMTP